MLRLSTRQICDKTQSDTITINVCFVSSAEANVRDLSREFMMSLAKCQSISCVFSSLNSVNVIIFHKLLLLKNISTNAKCENVNCRRRFLERLSKTKNHRIIVDGLRIFYTACVFLSSRSFFVWNIWILFEILLYRHHNDVSEFFLLYFYRSWSIKVRGKYQKRTERLFSFGDARAPAWSHEPK